MFYVYHIKISPTEGPRSERARVAIPVARRQSPMPVNISLSSKEKYTTMQDRRASINFHRPGDALSAGWAGGGKEFQSIVVASPLMMVVLLGSSAQIASETTSESNPCRHISMHDDLASSHTCLSDSAKCSLALSIVI